jgi:hypothetical protein
MFKSPNQNIQKEVCSMDKHTQNLSKAQGFATYSAYLGDRVYDFLHSLLVELDADLDRRLVETFLGLVMVLITHRHRNHGLLLSELGGYLLPPEHAPAGTKRLSNLLGSLKWGIESIISFFWQQADRYVEELNQAGETVLAIWDESVLEKPESLHLEGLCAVRSTKAVRLKRIKPGYYNPPGGRPIFVPGYNWLQVLVCGMQGPPRLAHLRFWTTRGERQTTRREEEGEILRTVSQRWSSRVLHVWDRGFAGAPWLSMAYVHAVRFVLRWPKHYHLVDELGCERKAWEITRGKRSLDHRLIWDARRRCQRKTGLVFVPVFDKTLYQPLTLVVARPGKGREPWYLLTNEPVLSAEDGWRIVLAYARRWLVEMSIRLDKAELAFESPRLQSWERFFKLLWIVVLAQAFLLSLLQPDPVDIANWLLKHWCHRTGKWRQEVLTPLYRLRTALSRLWLTYPPPFLCYLSLSSG